MPAGVQTFWLEETDEVAVGLRRYTAGNGTSCETGYHSALVYIGREQTRLDGHGGEITPDDVPHDDPRWPSACEACGIGLPAEAVHQPWSRRVWRRTDTGELRILQSNAGAPFAPAAEPGACWDATWLPDMFRGRDGIALMVRCPGGGNWMVDSQAANCTRKGQLHECWVRHGDPRDCHVTVDKNGDTCSAGAGSILTANWHGFLRDGVLVTC